MDDMACQELVELVTDYLEGVLGPVQTRRVNEHLAGCEGCESYIAQVRLTVRAAAELSNAGEEQTVDARLMDLHRQWLQGRARR